MFQREVLEQHYNKLPSEHLHLIRNELLWQAEQCGVDYKEPLQIIEKILSLRGEILSVRQNRKILFLCKCGQSRILQPNIPEEKIKMFIFEQYNMPCQKYKAVNSYTWKYLD